MHKWWLTLVPLVLVASLGCRVTGERRIVGTYKADCPCLKITLLLKSDHAFVEKTITNTGKIGELRGRWSIDQKFKTVDLRPFLDFREGEPGKESDIGSFKPEFWFGRITIGPIVVKCPESDYEINFAN